MSRDTRTILGITAAACAACCIGPIVAVLGVIGLTTVIGVAIFGVVAMAVAVLAVPVLRTWHRRRRGLDVGTAMPVATPLVHRPS